MGYLPIKPTVSNGNTVAAQNLTVASAAVSFAAFNTISNVIAMQVFGGDVYCTLDGTTPSSSNGGQLFNGQTYHWDPQTAQRAKFIRVSTSATIYAQEAVNALDQSNLPLDMSIWKPRASITEIYSSGYQNVMAFGATGNGTTDDTVAVNAALAYIQANGGTIYFPAGQYYCPNGINWSAPTNDSSHQWRLIGDGGRVSQILTHNANISLDLGGRNRVILEHIGINDNGTAANVGIARYGTSDLSGGENGDFHTYRDVYVTGIYLKACVYSIASEVNDHYDCYFVNNATGAGYATNSSNFLSVSGSAHTISGGSNTVNNFYGGTIQGYSGGCSLYVTNGDHDNLNFYGTYFVGDSSGHNVRMGTAATDGITGNTVFDGCRFEATGTGTDAIYVLAGVVTNVKVRDCTGLSVYWDPASTIVSGAYGWVIDGNQTYGGRIVIPQITNCHIRIPPTLSAAITTVTINTGVANSYLEAQTFSFGGSAIVYSSLIIENNYSGTSNYNVIYGPLSPTGAGASGGSVMTLAPFGSAPATPVEGTLATASSGHWDPSLLGPGADYPNWYDGTNWHSLIPLVATPASSTANGVKGTVAFDASYAYFCYATNTWARVAITHSGW